MEEREIYASINSLLDEMWVCFEAVFLSMFQYEESFRFQQVLFKNQIRNGFQSFQFVRWVGENKIELFMAVLYISECVSAYGDALVCFDFAHDFADKGMMVSVLFYADDLVTFTRNEF